MISNSYLKYFRDAAVLGGIARAAKLNRVSSSAISQAIANLESHFDLKFLEHSKNRFQLTSDGQLMLEQCHKVLNTLDEMETSIQETKNTLAGDVVFATQQSIGHYLLPPFLKFFRQKYPNIKPKIKLAPTDVVSQWIEARTIDFGLSVDNFGDHPFLSLPIYKGRFVYMCTNQWTKKKVNSLEFITPGESTRERRTFARQFVDKYGHNPNIAIEIKSWGVVKKLASYDLGVGIIPDYLIHKDEIGNLLHYPLDIDPIPYSINAYYCKRRNKLSR
ncbi:MAG: LysR family transcriptional regulator, partial [Proteobacteria bacterium]|nr:LysR family transcriptional regulator [Pseudomonadota bacterium]